MKPDTTRGRTRWSVGAASIAVLCVALTWGADIGAQRGGGAQAPPAAPRSAREISPIDLTGYWVSVVTEDWRWRMATPPPGDTASVPLNAEGRKVAAGWDLDRDIATGNECRAFGVGGLARQPGRLRIEWHDASTLRMDYDAGTQTRLLHFDRSTTPSGEPTWQGHSQAEWEGPSLRRAAAPQPGQRGAGPAGPPVPGGGGQGLRGGPPPRDPAQLQQGGWLKIATSLVRAGYLRKNGVPYSANVAITEYVHRLPAHPNGDQWLLIVTTVVDPQYLTEAFHTSTHFKREADGSKWRPTPCRTAPPPPAQALRAQ